MKIIITGGAGFIGSAVVREAIENTDFEILVIDKLTYAGNLSSLPENKRLIFNQTDICHEKHIKKTINSFSPDIIMHLAAESHVDRSIDGPRQFIETNINGTFVMLEAAREYYESLNDSKKGLFKFHHISTDEVYGDLKIGDHPFTEKTSYSPSSPYSASKASSDHLVRSWHRTFGLPVVITNCSNNYGPYHFPEKLIPLTILNALNGKRLPVYGDGLQIRDWLYVEDHAKALLKVALEGKNGETYNIGGHNEIKNIDVVRKICTVLDEEVDQKPGNIKSFLDLIEFVKDRPGHDKRYAIDASKLEKKLGWLPNESFDSGIYKTVKWYLENSWWWKPIIENKYKGERLGGN